MRRLSGLRRLPVRSEDRKRRDVIVCCDFTECERTVASLEGNSDWPKRYRVVKMTSGFQHHQDTTLIHGEPGIRFALASMLASVPYAVGEVV